MSHKPIIPTFIWDKDLPRGRCASLEHYGLAGSISTLGNPYDNAQAESSVKTLKVEEVYLSGYETFSDAASRLPVFIKDVYNARRMLSVLGYLSPNRFETLHAQQAP